MKPVAIEQRHRRLAFRAVAGHDYTEYELRGHGEAIRNWIEQGIDGGPPMFESEGRVARAIAETEDEAHMAGRWEFAIVAGRYLEVIESEVRAQGFASNGLRDALAALKSHAVRAEHGDP